VRFGNSIIASAVTHIGGFLLALFIIGSIPVTPPPTDPIDDNASNIVWLNVPGPGRRGGAGDGKAQPPRKAERPKQDVITLPVAKPPTLTHQPLKDVPKPDTEINIQAVNASTGVIDLPGALTGLPTIPSPGSDIGAGAGMGSGPRGWGFGTGPDRGTGDDGFGPGNGVSMPSVVMEVKPSYTAAAMRAKVQGAVMVQAVVREDGSVGRVRIVRSLDRTFGLDEEALKAVKNWRFRPGQRQGRNVPVIVEIELTFTLR
jgi:periplasmic protein TonB